MKVLHIFNSLCPSGMETMLTAAASEFRRQGVATHALATLDDVGSYREQMEKSGIRTFHIARSKKTYATSLKCLLQEAQYDVVHIHPEAYFLQNLLICKWCGVKRIVRTVHSIFQYHGLHALKRHLVGFLARMLDVRCCAPGVSVQQNEWRNGNKCKLVLNWCDVEKFVEKGQRCQLRKQYNIPNDAFVLVSVGNCAAVKHHELILNALSTMENRTGIYYCHVGREVDGLPERVLARSLDLESNVRFLGAQDDVPSTLEMSDAFVMSSRREGFGIAVCEAALMKKICILTRVPGLQDLLDLFPEFVSCEQTPESMAVAIQKVVKMPSAKRIIGGETCHKRAVELFSPERGVREYMDVYR